MTLNSLIVGIMSNITVCKVLNKFDESNSENLVVCSVWEDGKLKVYILKSNSIMLFGEEVTEQLEKFAKTFNKTLDAYIQETKDILCGIKSDVDFFLNSSKFYWKRKKWSLGQINMNPVQDVGCLTSFILILVDEYSKNKNKLDDIEKDYQSVKLVNSDLMQKLSDFQSVKDQLEDGLYKKFALLLNSKKAKIKDLSDQLKKLEDSKNIFNDSTDGSESECETKNNTSSHSSPKSNQKRAYEKKSNVKSSNKRKKIDETSSFEASEKNRSKKAAIVNNVDKDEPTPSTSNDVKNFDEGEETPDLLSGESECDLELKFDEDKLEDSKIKESAINEEDSEEMF